MSECFSINVILCTLGILKELDEKRCKAKLCAADSSIDGLLVKVVAVLSFYTTAIVFRAIGEERSGISAKVFLVQGAAHALWALELPVRQGV